MTASKESLSSALSISDFAHIETVRISPFSAPAAAIPHCEARSSKTAEKFALISENSHINAALSPASGRRERSLPPIASRSSAPCPSPSCLKGVRYISVSLQFAETMPLSVNIILYAPFDSSEHSGCV